MYRFEFLCNQELVPSFAVNKLMGISCTVDVQY